MAEILSSAIPNPAEIRAKREAMVIGDLLSPAGGESEELTERTVRDRYIVCGSPLSHSTGAIAKKETTAKGKSCLFDMENDA